MNRPTVETQQEHKKHKRKIAKHVKAEIRESWMHACHLDLDFSGQPSHHLQEVAQPIRDTVLSLPRRPLTSPLSEGLDAASNRGVEMALASRLSRITCKRWLNQFGTRCSASPADRSPAPSAKAWTPRQTEARKWH